MLSRWQPPPAHLRLFLFCFCRCCCLWQWNVTSCFRGFYNSNCSWKPQVQVEHQSHRETTNIDSTLSFQRKVVLFWSHMRKLIHLSSSGFSVCSSYIKHIVYDVFPPHCHLVQSCWHDLREHPNSLSLNIFSCISLFKPLGPKCDNMSVASHLLVQWTVSITLTLIIGWGWIRYYGNDVRRVFLVPQGSWWDFLRAVGIFFSLLCSPTTDSISYVMIVPQPQSVTVMCSSHSQRVITSFCSESCLPAEADTCTDVVTEGKHPNISSERDPSGSLQVLANMSSRLHPQPCAELWAQNQE